MRKKLLLVLFGIWTNALSAADSTDQDLASQALVARYAQLLAQLANEQVAEQRADLLFALGETATAIQNAAFTNTALAVGFAKQHPEAFAYDEIGASWLYTGSHYQTLYETYPDSALADDAAYARTELLHAGECEGDVPCMLERMTREPLWFIQHYPSSPLVAKAQERVEQALLWLSGPEGQQAIRTDSAGFAYAQRLVDQIIVCYQGLTVPYRYSAANTLSTLRQQLTQ